MKLAAAGNVEVPAFLVLVSKGYAVERAVTATDDVWTATKGEDVFHADSPLQLLGVVVVAEERGDAWLATDEQLSSFMTRFETAG